jgi:hypothetical protein
MQYSNNKLLFLIIFTFGLASCTPVSEKDKSVLDYEERTVQEEIKLIASFDSLNHHFIRKSCYKCHHSKQSRIPIFETEEQILDHADDIIFYTEDGCDIGTCMPPLNSNGIPKAPIPTENVMNLFKQWVDSQE